MQLQENVCRNEAISMLEGPHSNVSVADPGSSFTSALSPRSKWGKCSCTALDATRGRLPVMSKLPIESSVWMLHPPAKAREPLLDARLVEPELCWPPRALTTKSSAGAEQMPTGQLYGLSCAQERQTLA